MSKTQDKESISSQKQVADTELEELLAKMITLRDELLQEEVAEDPLSNQLKRELRQAYKALAEPSETEKKEFDKEFVQMSQALKYNLQENIVPLLEEIEQHAPKQKEKRMIEPAQIQKSSPRLLQNEVEKPYAKSTKKKKQKEWKKYTRDMESKHSENIFPAYFYAGFWIRVLSFLVDITCISSITTIFITNLFTLFQWNKSKLFFSPYMLLGVVIYLSYFIFLTKFNHGQTIGKMIFGLRVVSFNEKELSWHTVLIREGVCRFILKYPLLMIGYLPAAFTQNKQHIGDFFSDTSVVSINLIKAFRGERA